MRAVAFRVFTTGLSSKNRSRFLFIPNSRFNGTMGQRLFYPLAAAKPLSILSCASVRGSAGIAMLLVVTMSTRRSDVPLLQQQQRWNCRLDWGFLSERPCAIVCRYVCLLYHFVLFFQRLVSSALPLLRSFAAFFCEPWWSFWGFRKLLLCMRFTDNKRSKLLR